MILNCKDSNRMHRRWIIRTNKPYSNKLQRQQPKEHLERRERRSKLLQSRAKEQLPQLLVNKFNLKTFHLAMLMHRTLVLTDQIMLQIATNSNRCLLSIIRQPAILINLWMLIRLVPNKSSNRTRQNRSNLVNQTNQQLKNKNLKNQIKGAVKPRPASPRYLPESSLPPRNPGELPRRKTMNGKSDDQY